MENHSNKNANTNQKLDSLQKDIHQVLNGHNLNGTEKDWNAKILEITIKIRDQYPELSKYIEEMPVTIPDQKNPEITLKSLEAYYESLNTILNKYILEHPVNSK